MIINRLIMHNFGVYASDNTFTFNSQKPVVLIGGMNGRGKTTFLEAILLALYGKNSPGALKLPPSHSKTAAQVFPCRRPKYRLQ